MGMHPALAKAKFEAALASITEELLQLRNWTIFSKEWPLFDVGFTSPKGCQLRIALTCNDWDELPPSIALLTWTGEPLKTVPRSTTNIFHQGPHPDTGKPFVCMAGVREYHTHPSHRSDFWSGRRGDAGYSLGEIVTQIWNAWRGSNP